LETTKYSAFPSQQFSPRAVAFDGPDAFPYHRTRLPTPTVSEDTHTLSHFKRNSPKVMAKLKKTGRPLVLTVNGKEKAVLLDAAAYRTLRARMEREEMEQFLKDSISDVNAGRTRPAIEALDRLAKRFGLTGANAG
jgi:prevent-host-death family protein